MLVGSHVVGNARDHLAIRPSASSICRSQRCARRGSYRAPKTRARQKQAFQSHDWIPIKVPYAIICHCLPSIVNGPIAPDDFIVTVASRWPFYLLLFFATTSTLGQAPSTVFLDDLTSPELKEQIQSGKTTIIVPIGGTEQNGPHMALGKHNVRAKALAEKIAVALGDALVAPVIAYVPEGRLNPPTAHLRFPGTITIPDETFRKVLEYAARSFKLHGFHDIVFLGDHGGYQADAKAVVDQLNREWVSTRVRVHAVSEYYRVTQTDFTQALKARGYRDQEIGTHAGLADTSLMLAIDPRLVRIDALHENSKPGSGDGVYGDPRRSSAELGQLGVDAIVARTVEAIRKSTRR
jgi:creatinine amidohydrolase/Fe(II)-dependent formamide hydrolase-like protein